jgi:hypothetical protein
MIWEASGLLFFVASTSSRFMKHARTINPTSSTVGEAVSGNEHSLSIHSELYLQMMYFFSVLPPATLYDKNQNVHLTDGICPFQKG